MTNPLSTHINYTPPMPTETLETNWMFVSKLQDDVQVILQSKELTNFIVPKSILIKPELSNDGEHFFTKYFDSDLRKDGEVIELHDFEAEMVYACLAYIAFSKCGMRTLNHVRLVLCDCSRLIDYFCWTKTKYTDLWYHNYLLSNYFNIMNADFQQTYETLLSVFVFEPSLKLQLRHTLPLLNKDNVLRIPLFKLETLERRVKFNMPTKEGYFGVAPLASKNCIEKLGTSPYSFGIDVTSPTQFVVRSNMQIVCNKKESATNEYHLACSLTRFRLWQCEYDLLQDSKLQFNQGDYLWVGMVCK